MMVKVPPVYLEKPTVFKRIERKFFVQPRNIGLAYGLLGQFCYPDRDYPVEQINSLYFDTEDLEQYTFSSSGDYRKNKVRLRWYHTLDDYSNEVPVFIELKSREGFTSYKQRQRTLVPRISLVTKALNDGVIPYPTLINTIAEFGYFPEKLLVPIILISYRRYRFTEIVTGSRVSLDYNIRSTIIKPGLNNREKELPLAGGVIEVKGQQMELPVTLHRMRLLDLDWSRFSKYAACLDAHLEGPGTIARGWPSGRSNARH